MGLLTPVGANALGVGDIRLRSALNQALDAEIPLVLSGNDALDDVKISLASPEAFARAGIDRQYFLTRLQFQAIQKPDGAYAIKVSSREAMQEPFLNFLVEVNWPQGRMQKEFTVLLDPPVSLPETRRTPIREPAIERPIRPMEAEPPVRQYRRPAPTINVAPPVRRAPARTAEDTDPKHFSGNQYGPVQRRETLWGIARAVNRDPAVSHEQMAVALYRYNPGAFYADSVHALKAGAVLRVPDREFVAQRSPEDASREFYGSRTGGAERTGPITYPTPRANVADSEDTQPRSQLKLLPTPEDKKPDGVSSGGEARSGKPKGDLALEVAETVRQENDEFRSRLQQMEQKLVELQRMLILKDQEIASLQRQPQTTTQPPAVTPPVQQTPPVENPVVEPPHTKPEPPVAITPEVTPPAVQPTPVPTPVARPQPKPVQPPAVVAEEQDLLDEILDQPFLLAAFGGVLLLGLAGLMILRRRAAMIAETESILVATERETAQQKAQAAAISKLAAEAAAAPKESQQQETKSSFLSEFTTSDFDALGNDGDEVDPISEADVYLAYGRYKQAEELIGNAIEQHPGRDEFKLKLLEIHYATGNQQAFQAYARQLAAQGKDQQAGFWGKVVEMGHELCPDDPMFAKAPLGHEEADEDNYDSSGFDPALALSSMDLSDDIIEDLKRFEIELLDDTLADFDIDESTTAPANAPKHGISLDFEPTPVPKPEKPKATSAKLIDEISRAIETPAEVDTENLIAFDFVKPKAPVKPASAPRAEKSIDDIIREMTGSKESPLSRALDGSSAQPDDMHELDFELDFSSVDAPKSRSSLDLGKNEGQFSDITDADELETKLDLAKAYSDMDDDDMARDILEEVINSGDDRQKSEAKLLLDKIEEKHSTHDFPRAETRSGRL